MSTLTIVLIVVGVVVLWLIVAYNSLVRLRNRAREASSDIEVQQKRRYNLIPNLVEAVKGYMKHERGVFEKVTEARTRAMNSTGKEKAGAENMLSNTLKTLFAVSENYPTLRRTQIFWNCRESFPIQKTKFRPRDVSTIQT